MKRLVGIGVCVLLISGGVGLLLLKDNESLHSGGVPKVATLDAVTLSPETESRNDDAEDNMRVRIPPVPEEQLSKRTIPPVLVDNRPIQNEKFQRTELKDAELAMMQEKSNSSLRSIREIADEYGTDLTDVATRQKLEERMEKATKDYKEVAISMIKSQ